MAGGEAEAPSLLAPAASPGETLGYLSRLIAYRHVVRNFVLTDMRVRYRRSVFGLLWNLISPLLNLAVLAVVFSHVLRTPVRSFAVYVFSGMVPFAFFSNSIQAAAGSLLTYEDYIKKIPAPRAVFPLSVVLAAFVDFLFSMAAMLLLAAVLKPPSPTHLLWLPLLALLLLAFCLGLGLVCSVITVYFRDFSSILRVALQLLFFAAPIIYRVEDLPPDTALRAFVTYNPLTRFLQAFRDVLYGVGGEGGEIRPVSPGGFTLVLLVIFAGVALEAGTIVFTRHEERLVFRL